MTPKPAPFVDLCTTTDWSAVKTAGNWRARTAHTIIGGILGTAIIALVVALSWVLVSFGKYTQETLTFLRALIYFALTLTAVMITMSAVSFYRTLNGDAFSTPAALMIATGVLAVAAGARTAVRTRRLSRNEEPQQRKKFDERQQRRVNQLAGGTLAYLAAASVTAGLVLTSTSVGWKDPDGWIIHAAAWGALTLPLLVLLTAVGAIAHHVPATAPASANEQAPAPGVPEARKPDETAGNQ